ncbi:hypothetical protein PR202_gb03078 [Eleusine coracana subsp. coracana]|uniref:Defective in cullin neddylation protein n=1 Tax=Eleusine coracana subsp. coracana TaxID=191504 RepID=A0AAV5E0U0_ELECO|nr:hypothetical protein PR202_gb03078 [Eleusine coracana subsp. coracana]
MRRSSKKSSSSAAPATAGSTKAVSKEVERIDQFFYTYADRSSGMIEKMGSEKQGYFTLDEWRTALKALRADSISKLKKSFPELVQEVMRPSNFLDFYTYSFRYCLTEDKKKCIEIPVACELLNLVLGLQFRPQVDKLISYLKFQSEYKVINMDQWMGFYRFCNEALEALEDADSACF